MIGTTYTCTDCGDQLTDTVDGFLDNETPICECGGQMLPADLWWDMSALTVPARRRR